jgi:hypothetical protein
VDGYGPRDVDPSVVPAQAAIHGPADPREARRGAPQPAQARDPALASGAAATATATATGPFWPDARQFTARQVASAARITDAQTFLLSLPGFDEELARTGLQQLRRLCYPHPEDPVFGRGDDVFHLLRFKTRAERSAAQRQPPPRRSRDRPRPRPRPRRHRRRLGPASAARSGARPATPPS